ncbi:hypothetical protein AB4Z50_14980 [Paenibacillus sp. 2TAB26]|uniref:hypothetical protein n=1 Tax=Paenibacillus sp. 2TAB26 TaxID=3233005 RepID=UPI003F99934B
MIISDKKLVRFDIGVPYDGGSLTMEELIKEIQGEAEVESPERSKNETPINIRQKLVGSPSGLRPLLKKRLYLDLDTYGEEQQFEKLKLLKLLYQFEKSYSGKVRITDLLSKTSLENVDKRSIGEDSANGSIVTELQLQLRREVGDVFPQDVETTLNVSVSLWHEKLRRVAIIASNRKLDREVRLQELKRIRDGLARELTAFPPLVGVGNAKVMESFYLRVSQMKQLAKTDDLSRAIAFLLQSSQTMGMLQANIEPLELPPLIVKDPKAYVAKSIDKVAAAVFGRVDTTGEERSELIRLSVHIEPLFEQVKQQGAAAEHDLNPLFIVSCLQEILMSARLKIADDEFEYRNPYYGWNSKGQPLMAVLRKLTNGKHVEEACRLVWILKVLRRRCANQGTLEDYIVQLDIEKLVNEVFVVLAKLPTLTAVYASNRVLGSQIVVTLQPLSFHTERLRSEVADSTGFIVEWLPQAQCLFQYFEDPKDAEMLIHIIVRHILAFQEDDRNDDTRTVDERKVLFYAMGEEITMQYAFNREVKSVSILSFRTAEMESDRRMMLHAGFTMPETSSIKGRGESRSKPNV